MNKLKNKISLKMQVTILVGLIITIVSIAITALGIYNSQLIFMKPTLLNDVLSVEATQPAIEVAPSFPSGTIAAETSVAAKQIMATAQTGFSQNSIIIMVVILFFGLALTYFLIGKALVPLSALSGAVANITEQNLSEKITAENSSKEVSNLTNAFNEMLCRLQQSFEQQKRFSSSAAHELKTPLATIKTSMQVLNLDEAPTIEDYRENAFVVSQSVDRLIEIVGNLLLFSNSNSEMNEELRLAEIAQDCINELSEKFNAKSIKLTQDISDCTMLGNSSLIRSAIYNLIDNAIKYNRQSGKINICIKPQNGITIEVSDNGIGIAPNDLDRIFEPFYRADQSRSKEISGNGLGVAIVKSIVENHGGSLNIKSQLSIGTTATINFPN